MIIDACVFCGESLHRNSVTVDALLEQMKASGVDWAVIRPNMPCDYNYDRANRDIAAIQKKHPALMAFGRVNPWEKTAPQQVFLMREYGLRGLHLHPWEENFMISAPFVREVLQAAQDCGFPVYVSAGYPCVSEPLQLLEAAAAFPQTTFIATHGGQLDMSGLSFDDALLAAREAKNLKFDLSGVYRRDFIELLVSAAGEENVLFGSCTPYMDMGFEIDRIAAAQIPQTQKDRIFCGNIASLLDL